VLLDLCVNLKVPALPSASFRESLLGTVLANLGVQGVGAVPDRQKRDGWYSLRGIVGVVAVVERL
jgi:hypothetical protein